MSLKTEIIRSFQDGESRDTGRNTWINTKDLSHGAHALNKLVMPFFIA